MLKAYRQPEAMPEEGEKTTELSREAPVITRRSVVAPISEASRFLRLPLRNLVLAAGGRGQRAAAVQVAAQDEAPEGDGERDEAPVALQSRRGAEPSLNALREMLTKHEVEPSLIEHLCKQARRELRRGADDAAAAGEAWLRGAVEKLVVGGAALRLQQGSPTVLFIVGPTGSGKTTAAGKIVARQALCGRKVALISVDTWRCGALAQLDGLARAMGVPLHTAEDTEQLARTVRGLGDRDLIVVDTPGVNPLAPTALFDLATFTEAVRERQVHLVLHACQRASDALAWLQAVGPALIDALLFTHIDETVRFGSVLSVAVRSGKPLSYFGCGAVLPDGLVVASPTRMAQLLGGGYGDAL